MDKYEYKLKLDEMKSLAGEGNYEQAEEIADSINWKKVKNVNSLVLAGEIYSKRERYEESRDVLLMAYDRSPIGRMIIYRLAELAITMHSFDEAKDYYDEFVEVAPHDNLKYVLRYNLCREQGQQVEEQIKILEELKEQEYTERWAYELAHLYHEAGMSDKCVDACDELVLWFGEGDFVEKAMELKMLYQPLNSQQEEKYRAFRREQIEKEGVVEVQQDEDLESGEIVAETVQIPKVTTNTGKFNTVNLQEELAKSMQQIMDATEKETVSDTMDSIKKMMEDIPYLQISHEEEKQHQPEKKYAHIETDEEIDGSLKINFQEILGEEFDGQLNLNVPERAMIERQITGQMSISDVLDEWEKTKYAAEMALQEAEQRKLESAKARALREAEELMERLKDVVPQLDAGVTPMQLLEKEYLDGQDDEAAGRLVANMNHILQQEIDKLSRTTEDLDKMLQEKKEDKEEKRAKSLVQPTKRIPSLEEFMKKTFFHGDDLLDELLDEEFSEEEPEIEDLNLTDPAAPQEESAEIETPEAVDNPEEPQEEVSEELEENQDEDFEEDVACEEDYDGDDEDVEHEEDYDEDVEYEEDYDGDDEDVGYEEDYDGDGEADYDDELTDDEREIFSYFMLVNGMEEQIRDTMFGSMNQWNEDRSFGHIIIQGVSGSGKTVLATSMIKALQKETGKPDGRIGKIEGASLNKKDIAALLHTVANGSLIIEHAGDISRETAIRLALCLKSSQSDPLIILEDTKEGIKKALGRDEGFARKFTEKIVIPIFTSDELVAFAKAYANELGYDIDEMATLALYNRISNIQRLDEPTNLTEVKEIVDEAIARAEKGGIKKMFSILTSRRYTQDDYIALREKDFDE